MIFSCDKKTPFAQHGKWRWVLNNKNGDFY